jgi:TonB-dependent SusC/RagA subfamily outer membrane receptor
MKTIRLFLFLLPLIICVSLVNHSDTDDPRIEKIIRQLNLFNEKCSQQKVYLQTDKNVYMAGETMWIKAYLLDASTMGADTVSKDIYVELLDMNQRPVNNLILRNRQGFSNGDILLKDTLLEGSYQLRAYSNWMRNFNSDYFFFKTITVKNPNYENVITRARLKSIKQFNRILKRKGNDYTVSFFPEGGNLVAGKLSTVAFKAVTALGMPLEVKGTIFDNKGNHVTDFQSIHDGMGTFKLTPNPGTRYIAKVTYQNGKTRKFSLPQALPKGIVMSVDPFRKDEIRVFIESNRSVSENIASNEVIIVGQSRGMIVYISKGEVKEKPVMSVIPKKIFPPGVAQITLFNGRGEPVCERLVFIDPQSETNSDQVSLASTTAGDSIIYHIKLTKPNGHPVQGNLSLSVVENIPNTTDSCSENILTNLLLTSDLRGRINNPLYYFDKTNPDAGKYLDLVMLTNGWRRFVWKELMANQFPLILYPKVGGILISGRITRDFFGIPIPKSKVVLSILKTYNDKFETTTDSKGRFEFPIMEYEDTIGVKIEAFKPSGGKGVQIILGDTLTPNVTTIPYPSYFNVAYDKKKMRKNTHQEIIEKRKGIREKPEDENEPMKIYDHPSDALNVGEDVNSYSNILQYMQGKIPGVNVMDNRVIIRGVNTILGSTDPLYLLDGVPIDASSVSAINPHDISRIEVLKGPDASIYGSRGANGVIAFYSKRGHFMKRGVIEFDMLGYYKAREFYVPPYDTWAYKPEDYNVPRTVYWKPYVSTNAEGEATIRFKKKFPTGKMNATLEGMTSSGEIIYKKAQN